MFSLVAPISIIISLSGLKPVVSISKETIKPDGDNNLSVSLSSF